MSRVAFIADAHVGNHGRFHGPAEAGVNLRARLTLDALRRATRQAEEAGAEVLVVLGDLLDSARPTPQVLTATLAALDPARLDVVTLVGNHERVSLALGDHSLGPFPHAAMPVVERPSVIGRAGCHLICVPWGYDLVEAARTLVPTIPTDGPRLLCFHAGISDDQTATHLVEEGVRWEALADLCRDLGVTLAIGGHWHRGRAWTTWQEGLDFHPAIIQAGALCPTGFSDSGLLGYGALVIYDAEEDEVHSVEVSGPRFVTSTEEADSAAFSGHKVFVRLEATPDEVCTTRAWLDEAKAEGRVVDGEVLVSSEEARQAARDAARVARASETLDEALTAYVGGMDLDALGLSAVDRVEVLKRARTYLGRR